MNRVKSFVATMFGNTREAVSEQIGRIFLLLLLPSVSAGGDAEDRGAMQFDLVKLAFALAAYRADHGSYPAKLADLASSTSPRFPRTSSTARNCGYKRKAEGYLLYSVGVNGKDDGGRGYDDCKPGETWDDLVVRVPAEVRASEKAE